MNHLVTEWFVITGMHIQKVALLQLSFCFIFSVNYLVGGLEHFFSHFLIKFPTDELVYSSEGWRETTNQ